MVKWLVNGRCLLQVAIETLSGELDFQQLAGLWRLVYTTASDVLPLVATTAPSLLPLRVSDVYQQFSAPEEGSVRNIIDFSVWPLLQVSTNLIMAGGCTLGKHGFAGKP